MTDEGKNAWRENWLSSINELTSIDLQRNSWLDKTHTNPHWSFVEFMCSYFDDLAIENSYDYHLKKGWISNQELEIVREWHELLDKYNSPKNNDYDHEAILNDPRWLELVQKGLIVKARLTEILNHQETSILNEEIDY